MGKTELEDFRKILSENNLSEKDLEIKEADLTDWQPNTIVRIKGTLTIKHKNTKKEKTYSTGWGTHWVCNFEIDVKSGFFN